jgi:phage-related protein
MPYPRTCVPVSCAWFVSSKASGSTGSVRRMSSNLQGRLWEVRLRGRDGIARALYVTVTGQRVVVVRVFVKKTQKTPRREIELALERAKEIVS